MSNEMNEMVEAGRELYESVARNTLVNDGAASYERETSWSGLTGQAKFDWMERALKLQAMQAASPVTVHRAVAAIEGAMARLSKMGEALIQMQLRYGRGADMFDSINRELMLASSELEVWLKKIKREENR